MRGYPVEQLQSRERRRGKADVDPTVDQRHSRVDRGNGAEYTKHAKNCRANPGCIKGKQRRRKKDCGDKRD